MPSLLSIGHEVDSMINIARKHFGRLVASRQPLHLLKSRWRYACVTLNRMGLSGDSRKLRGRLLSDEAVVWDLDPRHEEMRKGFFFRSVITQN